MKFNSINLTSNVILRGQNIEQLRTYTAITEDGRAWACDQIYVNGQIDSSRSSNWYEVPSPVMVMGQPTVDESTNEPTGGPGEVSNTETLGKGSVFSPKVKHAFQARDQLAPERFEGQVPVHAGAAWDESQEHTLISGVVRHMDIKDIAQQLGRSTGSIYSRIKKIRESIEQGVWRTPAYSDDAKQSIYSAMMRYTSG